MNPFCDIYGKGEDENTPGKRLAGIIRKACEKTGSQAVVIIDEYDAPLLDVLHEEEYLKGSRRVMQHMQAYLAGLPYVEGFKEKLKDAANAEGFYEYTFYLIFSMLNVYVRTQMKCAGGRSDIVVHMPDTVYVLELKAGGSAEEALAQINSRGYALPYTSEGKAVVKVGVAVDREKRTVQNWIVG